MKQIDLTSTTFLAAPNQRAFQVHKNRIAEDEYDVRVPDIYKRDLLLAAQDLKDTTFKVYIYLLSNQDSYIGGLSKVDVINQTGISESSYRRAMKELEEKNYWVYTKRSAKDCQGNRLPLYDFYARPDHRLYKKSTYSWFDNEK